MNRSAPHARVTPVLTVADVRSAVAWYSEVFGFVEHVRIGDGHRSQLGLPDGPPAELVVAEVRPGRGTPEREGSHQVMLKVTDVRGGRAERGFPTWPACGGPPWPGRRAWSIRHMTGSTASGRPPSMTPSGISGCSTRR